MYRILSTEKPLTTVGGDRISMGTGYFLYKRYPVPSSILSPLAITDSGLQIADRRLSAPPPTAPRPPSLPDLPAIPPGTGRLLADGDAPSAGAPADPPASAPAPGTSAVQPAVAPAERKILLKIPKALVGDEQVISELALALSIYEGAVRGVIGDGVIYLDEMATMGLEQVFDRKDLPDILKLLFESPYPTKQELGEKKYFLRCCQILKVISKKFGGNRHRGVQIVAFREESEITGNWLSRGIQHAGRAASQVGSTVTGDVPENAVIGFLPYSTSAVMGHVEALCSYKDWVPYYTVSERCKNIGGEVEAHSVIFMPGPPDDRDFTIKSGGERYGGARGSQWHQIRGNFDSNYGEWFALPVSGGGTILIRMGFIDADGLPDGWAEGIAKQGIVATYSALRARLQDPKWTKKKPGGIEDSYPRPYHLDTELVWDGKNLDTD